MGSPFTGRRPRKTISRLARLDPHTSATTRNVAPGEIPDRAGGTVEMTCPVPPPSHKKDQQQTA